MPDSTDREIDAYVKSLAEIDGQRDREASDSLAWAELDSKLDQEERAREPKMTDQEWASHVARFDRQYETPTRSEWYRQTQAEHEMDLKAPQRFALTGDGLVTEHIIKDGPFHGPDIGAELKMARYRDHQYTGNVMPLNEIQAVGTALNVLLNKSPQQELQLQLSLTQARDREIEQPTQKQTRTRSLGI